MDLHSSRRRIGRKYLARTPFLPILVDCFMPLVYRFCLPELCTLVMSMFCLLANFADAQSVYPLSDPKVKHRVDNYVTVFIDSTNSLTIEDVSARAFQRNFRKRENGLAFGYLKSDLWLKIEVQNNLPATSWLMEIPAPFLEYVDFYQRKEGEWYHAQSGYYRPHDMREFQDTGHTWHLLFDKQGRNTVYIKIAGLSPKTFPLHIWEAEKFGDKVRGEDVGYGIFFGILMVMFLYNFMLFISLNQVNYLLYILTIVCTALIFGAASGYAGKFLWPQNPDLNFYAGRLTLPFLTIILSVFTIRFLEVQRYARVMYYVLLAQIALSVVAFILVTTKFFPGAGNHLVSISTIVYITTGIVCTLRGNKTAVYYIAAWTIYLAGGLLLTLRNSGVLQYNFWTTHFVEIGAAMETTIIALALGDRYRRYKMEKEEAQALALRVQREANERLESKVKERTEQLSKANEELQSTLETVKLQARLIENKNAELDSFFYRISHDLKGPISSLLGLTALARHEIREPEALVYIEKQQQQVERLKNIINGLIKLTKLNDAELQLEPINFHKMIDDCVASAQGLSNFPLITFEREVQLTKTVSSEWTLLNAILQNLIENAIKYAQSTAPFVKIRVWNDETHMVIQVEDNGVGIPDEHQTKIFEMFYRATQSVNGSGLGLYILKRSVDRLGGVIDIRSAVDVGSTFTVKLPLKIS